jgi:hypothetical protein
MANSILDFLTGGASSQAQGDLATALQNIEGVQTPTVQQLTLPELQQYVNAGLLTPAQMQAYLQQNNALATENVPQTGTAAQIAALNQLSGIANAGAAGTPVEQAQQAQTIQQMNEAIAGQRGAIEQGAEARGTPAALVQAALENQTVGQEGEQAYQNALQSQAQAYQTALNAMTAGGQAGQALQGQENTQANTVAAAQNAMQQFNAQNQQAAGAQNAAYQQAANTYNAQNAQNIANENTQNANTRTAYNAQVPETVFENQMGKAQQEAGVGEQQANQANQQGQQMAGLEGGLLGAGATLGGSSILANALAAGQTPSGAGINQANQIINGTQLGAGGAPINTAEGGIIGDHDYCYHEGGICMRAGGMVPGKPKVQGDSIKNDTVPIHASPGEAVIPRTAVQQHFPEVLALLSGHGAQPEAQHHPQDVATLLQAMKSLRAGV